MPNLPKNQYFRIKQVESRYHITKKAEIFKMDIVMIIELLRNSSSVLLFNVLLPIILFK